MSRAGDARDQAARWIVAREEPDWTDASQAELDAWLVVSDLNRVAFLRLEHSWSEVGRIRSLGGAAPKLPAPQADDPATSSTAASAWRPLAIAASVAVLIGTGLSVRPSWTDDGRTRVVATRSATAVGTRKTLGLPDGSRLELNTASVVRTALVDDRREVWLDQGEAYFEVKHDAKRPFIVHAGSRNVTVLGTKFSVRRDGDKVSVFVREGRVRVDDVQGNGPVRSATITQGDIALSQGAATLVTTKADERVADALAWRGGMLSFNQERLADVAAEFNRYNQRQLIVTDRGAASLRIGGMFPASRPQDFVQLLRDAYGLKIEEGPQSIKISS